MEELDVNGVLGFAEHVMPNASKMWLEADCGKKEILQQTLFPHNISYLDGKFLEAATCLLYNDLQIITSKKSNVG